MKLNKRTLLLIPLLLLGAVGIYQGTNIIWQNTCPGTLDIRQGLNTGFDVTCYALDETPGATATNAGTTPTPGPTSTKTNTPAPTVTPAGTALPAPTATQMAANPCFYWHPFGFDAFHPELEFHHHGHNPCDYIPIFGDVLFNYLATNGVTGYPLSSVLEEHDGLAWLYTHTDTCQLFVSASENLPADVACITDALVRVHTTGRQAHGLKEFHSSVEFYRVCDRETLTQCDTVFHAQIADYGVIMNPYKQSLCNPPLAVDGTLYTDLNQPPYRGFQPPEVRGDDPPAPWNPAERFVSEIWSTISMNQIIKKWYPTDPNYTSGLTWTLMDAREYFLCNGEGLRAESNNASRFMFFAAKLRNLPLERPFVGFNDIYGHISACTAPTNTCFPFYIGANVPVTHNAWLNYEVRQNGDNPLVEQQEFHP